MIMGRKVRPKLDARHSKGIFVCPECGSENVKTNEADYTFTYGTEGDRFELSARIPIRECPECGFSFRDCVADDICHEAVCHHLGVMSPRQIKGLRNLYKLTQAEFCEITKLGEATLSRWERGIFIQNEAYDNYLYLLGFRGNLGRLLKRQGKKTPELVTPTGQPRFRKIELTEELRRKQKEFELQPCVATGE